MNCEIFYSIRDILLLDIFKSRLQTRVKRFHKIFQFLAIINKKKLLSIEFSTAYNIYIVEWGVRKINHASMWS